MIINNAVLTGSFTVNGVNYITNTPTTGSNTYVGTQTISGSTLITGSLQVTGSIATTGTITAQTLVVQTVTSSIVYSSGSNIFGNQLTNVQQMTGSLRVTGSGNHYIQGGKVAISSSVAADVLLNVVNPSSTGYGMNISAASGSGTYALRVENYNGASSLLYVRGDGNVGIGTTTPSATLQIQGSGDQYIKITSTNNANAGVRFNSIGGNEFGIFSDTSLRFYDFTAAAERMRITSGGNVGIGTSSPSNKLSVLANGSTSTGADSSAGFVIYGDTQGSWMSARKTSATPSEGQFGADSTGTFLTSLTTHPIVFRPANTEAMRITSGGNVVINSTVANYKFQVNSGISTSTATVMTLQQATNGAVKDAAGFGLAIQNGGEATNAADLIISTASGGSLVERMRITSGGDITVKKTSQDAYFQHQGAMDVANGGTLTLGVANGTLVFVTDNNIGDGAIFFCTYASQTVILIADPNSHYAATDTAGRACLYKTNNNTGVVTFKNNLGATRSFTIFQMRNSD